MWRECLPVVMKYPFAWFQLILLACPPIELAPWRPGRKTSINIWVCGMGMARKILPASLKNRAEDIFGDGEIRGFQKRLYFKNEEICREDS